jgi:CheY-like chemotaxis protein
LLSGRRTLLLADDSPTIQKVVSLTFEDELEVVAVSDGAQALRLLESATPPDILLADVWMPGPNGYELCEHVKRDARLRHIPVVLLVGTFEPFNEAEARRVGADTVLTKPFQSIRDMFSKVGSLLGGKKHEEETTVAQPRTSAESAEETMTRQADVPMQSAYAEASGGEAEGEHDETFGINAASSFADLGADDELIEAKPADSFGASELSEAWRNPVVQEPFTTHEQEARKPLSLQEPVTSEETAAAEMRDMDAFVESHAEARKSVEAREPAFAAQTSFAARAGAADEALLDIGQFQTPAARGAEESDDFVLDIDFDEPAPSYKEPVASYDEHASSFGEPAQSFTPFEAAAPSVWEEQETPAEVVMQDEPQTFSPHEVADARGQIVEPSVVPANEPVPATVEAEFTDGSVEGDVAKAPSVDYTTQPVAEDAVREPEAANAPERFVPAEPSAEGFAVGQSRTGLEEPLRADQLSPEAIERIARRVVELMSDKVVREVAWEVVPELAELLIKQKLEEEGKQ